MQLFKFLQKSQYAIDSHYITPDRLSDVIRLITVLAVERRAFRTEDGLKEAIRDSPRSAATWIDLAKDHPEFFRFNKAGNHITLLIRSSSQLDKADDDRPPLGIELTQKVIDQAIALHDKQLARYQRDSARMTLTAAWIAAAATIIVALISWVISAKENEKLEVQLIELKSKIESLIQFTSPRANEYHPTIDSAKKELPTPVKVLRKEK